MDDLSTLLRAASDAPPPSGIDLDRVIATERRRRSRLTVAATFVLVVTTVSVVVAVRPSPSPPPVAVTPLPVASPTPCVHKSLPGDLPDRKPAPLQPLPESPEAAAQRLTATLPALLPGGAHPGATLACGRVEFWWNKQAGAYQATSWLAPGRDETSLAIVVEGRESRDRTPHCLVDLHSCRRTDAPDGSVAMADLITLEAGGNVQRTVSVFRPDGTRVSLVVIGRPSALPSVARLASIGRAPELTLYP